MKRPGQLHRDLGVTPGAPIPPEKLAAAARSADPKIRQRANFAKVMKGLR